MEKTQIFSLAKKAHSVSETNQLEKELTKSVTSSCNFLCPECYSSTIYTGVIDVENPQILECKCTECNFVGHDLNGILCRNT